ncbi:MAG: SDR family NAD(P)-dependent oxidoreductase [Thermodesulfobacteriota bacterium]
MSHWLENRVAIITGSGRGIGRAIAMAMAKEGARVVTNDYDLGLAEAVAKEITDSGGKAVPFSGDIAEFEAAKRLIQTAADKFGRLDILVNNAGIGGGKKPIWEMTEEIWDRAMAVHLKGSFNCIRHASVIMKERKWGRIINTSSPGRLGMERNCDYSTAKAGVIGLTRSVALDLGGYGVTCNAYAPSAATRMNSKTSAEYQARLAKEYASGSITKEYYERQTTPRPPPEAIPPFIIYLCTDQAAEINGQLFFIWGRQEIHLFLEEVKNSIVKEGFWTVEELMEKVPAELLKGVESKISLSSGSRHRKSR